MYERTTTNFYEYMLLCMFTLVQTSSSRFLDWSCSEYAEIPAVGTVFHMHIEDRIIYYSDWGSSSVVEYHVDTNTSTTVLSNLMRPTRFELIQTATAGSKQSCTYMY